MRLVRLVSIALIVLLLITLLSGCSFFRAEKPIVQHTLIVCPTLEGMDPECPKREPRKEKETLLDDLEYDTKLANMYDECREKNVAFWEARTACEKRIKEMNESK